MSTSTLKKARDNQLAKTPSPPNLSGLETCAQEARIAALDNDSGPPDPTDYHTLLGRLQAAKPRLPKLYQLAAAQPFFDKLQGLGQQGFQQTLLEDPEKTGAGGLMLDIAQAILQDGEHFDELQTDAFEEVVADLYDGFLSAQDRAGIKMPDRAILPPMIKWGNPGFGPYTWPIDATSNFDLRTAIVSMPPANARRGLMAWAALPHEACGHDILHADIGLQAEMAMTLREELEKSGVRSTIANYWADRIDETSSDVMGILNAGPAAAIGVIAYFRGLGLAFGTDGKLRSDGPTDDPHPADILRGYLGAATVRLLSFDGQNGWAKAIDGETDNDLGKKKISLAGDVIDSAQAKKSAEVVAKVLVTHPMETLHSHSLIDIQDWRNKDEEVVRQLRLLLSTNVPISAALTEGVFAAHAVSAAVIGALAGDAEISIIFSRMVQMLKAMHARNPTWGPLAVIHRSNICRDLAFAPNSFPKIVPPMNIQGNRHAQFEEVLRRLEQALVDAGYPTPFDRTSDAVGVTGSVGALVRLVNQTFFPSPPRFTDGDLDEGDTIGDVALKILNLL